MTHFAVIAPPLPGHFNPLLVLARELKGRGHTVTFVHMADAARLVEGKGAAFHAVGEADHPPGALKAYGDRLAKPTGLPGLLGTLKATAAQTDMLCRDLPAALLDIGADAVIADQTEAAGGLVARHLGLPFISTATALLLNREPGVPPPFVPWPYDPSEKGLVKNKGGYFVTDLLMTPMRRVLERHGAAFGLDPRADQGFSPLLTVAQMPKALDFPRQELPASFHYGSPWRDEMSPVPTNGAGLPDGAGKPLVFCSLGTLQGARGDLFEKVARAANDLGVHLLIAHGGLLSANAVERLSAVAEVRAFVPQREVLRRCSAAVLHCGMNTVLDALAMGVPLVAVPIAFEQPATAARLAHAGVARVVPAGKASRASLGRALEAVLTDQGVKTSAQHVADEMAKGGGVKSAADLVEQALLAGRMRLFSGVRLLQAAAVQLLELGLQRRHRGRIEKAEGDAALLALHRMMEPVGLHQALEIAAPRHMAKRPALMGQPVMHEEIEEAVGGHPDAHPQDRAPVVAPQIDEDDGEGREQQRIEIVALEDAFARLVVGLVPAPAPAMHDVFVGKPRHAFHGRHGGDDDERVDEDGHGPDVLCGGRAAPVRSAAAAMRVLVAPGPRCALFQIKCAAATRGAPNGAPARG